MCEILFSKYPWFNVVEYKLEQVKKEIQDYNSNKLLNTPTDDLARYFIDRHTINIPTLMKDNISVDQEEAQIDVSRDTNRFVRDRNRPFYIAGVKIIYCIPFVGDKEAFYIRPSTYRSNPPCAIVNDTYLQIMFVNDNFNTETLKMLFNEQINGIEYHLNNLEKSNKELNIRLAAETYAGIEQRKEKLLQNQNLVASLGFPLKTRSNPATYAVNVAKRKIGMGQPQASTSPYVPEPALSDTDYEDILNILNNMSLVMERSPKAFVNLDEEALRMHFIMQLNGLYEGRATGETFNFNGKTDILIREGGKNLFIGECKFWGGPQKLVQTIDQLLGYSTWRDSKTAILLFNKNKNFSNVLKSIPEVVTGHPLYKKDLGNKSETIFRYKFINKEDSNKELFLTIMAFDIPQ